MLSKSLGFANTLTDFGSAAQGMGASMTLGSGSKTVAAEMHRDRRTNEVRQLVEQLACRKCGAFDVNLQIQR